MNRKLKRFLSSFMSLMMVVSLLTYSPKAVYGATVSKSDTSAEATYGLQSNIQDGVILHCWDWSFNNIKANMADIAAAGYSAVQTSPIQQAKEATKGGSNSHWWVLYQPATFNIDNTGNSALGTKAEFQAMVEEAHKYGVKVVVDIVANHTANNKGYDIASNVDPDIKNNASQTYHSEGFTEISDYTNRYRCTHYSMGGLPDLNTENSIVQGKVLGLLKECIDCGADGFRFDAAKHISIPAEGSEYTFWPNTLVAAQSYAKSTYGKDIYAYGEILDSAQVAIGGYTQYMSITDNGTSSTIMWGIKNGNAASAATSSYQKGEAANKAVLWPESHDTYSNDGKETTNVDQQIMDKAWAMEASRANATSLYYARTPYRSGDFGKVHTYNWKDAEVVAANKFHNYFVGTSEYLGYDGSIAYNVRNKKGIVLVNCGGTSTSVNFSISNTGMADGTYKDQVTGNNFTVSGGKISGNIGSTGVAVVYNADPVVLTPVATISQEGGNFTSDTLTLTVGLKNATSGTYQVGSNAAQRFTSSTTVTIGSGMSVGSSVTVTLTATDGTNNYSKAYTFKKVEKVSNIAYLALPSGWSDPYCYAYDSVTEVNNGEWPGVKMTKDSSTGYYKYEIPETITSPLVIFYSSDTNRYPADMQPGLALSGEMIYKDGSWSAYSGGGGGGTTVTLPDVPSGYKRVFFKNTAGWSTVKYYNWITGTNTSVAAWPGSAMTVCDSSQGIYYVDVNVSAGYKSIIFNNGGDVKTNDLTIPSTSDNLLTYSSQTWSTYTYSTGGGGTTTKGTVTVKYVDESGTSIATSTTLTGTVGTAYTTTAASVSGYTLSGTPTNASGTYTAAAITVTYVYKKNSGGGGGGTVVTPTNGLSADIYKINATGYGVNKTITSYSDFDDTMIIVQGAANDDARAFKGPHEGPVYDDYALYAAYDDNNLYVGWQYVNTSDVNAKDQEFPQSDNGFPDNGDIGQMLAFYVPGKTTTNGRLADGKGVWGIDVTFQTPITAVACFSSKSGVGTPGFFIPNASGNLSYDDDYCLGFKASGISYTSTRKVCLPSKVIGTTGNGYTGNTVSKLADSSNFTDLIASGHSTTHDSFYVFTIPLSVLGTSKSEIQSKGIGVMHISTFGASGINSLPMDYSMVDNAEKEYSKDESTSMEKEDSDTITTALASVGTKVGGGGSVITPDPQPLSASLKVNNSTSALTLSLGDTVNLSVAASGGSGSYKYKYVVHNLDTDSYYCLKDNSTSSSYSCSMTSAGNKEFLVGVTDSAGAYVKTAAIKVTVPSTALSGRLTINGSASSLSVNVGDTLTLVAAASGGSGSYKYKYVVHSLDTNEWYCLKDNSTSSSYSCKITGAGNKEFVVGITDSKGSYVKTQTIKVTAKAGSTTALKATLSVNGNTSSFSAQVGTSVKLSVSASGGSGSYKYKYVVHNLDTNEWYCLKDNSTSNSYTCKLTAAGNKEFVVAVTDTAGNYVKTSSIKVTVTSGSSSALTAKLTVNGSTGSLTAQVGSSVKLSVSASGGSGSYKYKYVVHNLDTNEWYCLKDNSTSNSYTCKLTAAGNKEFVVAVTDTAGNYVKTSSIKVTATK